MFRFQTWITIRFRYLKIQKIIRSFRNIAVMLNLVNLLSTAMIVLVQGGATWGVIMHGYNKDNMKFIAV